MTTLTKKVIKSVVELLMPKQHLTEVIIISQVKQGELKASSKKEHLPSCAIL